jgi:hypothetical protein
MGYKGKRRESKISDSNATPFRELHSQSQEDSSMAGIDISGSISNSLSETQQKPQVEKQELSQRDHRSN